MWGVDSPVNRDCAQKLWAEFPAAIIWMASPFSSRRKDCSPEQMLIDQMGTIDDRHGVYSADPPYTAIHVIGSGLTLEVRQILASFGFDSFTVTDDGFQAVRPLPPPLGR